MSIAKTISDIVKKRKDNIAPKYDSYWGDVRNVVEFAYDLEALLESDNWAVLLREHPDFREQWNDTINVGNKELPLSQVVISFIEEVKSKVGIKDGDVIYPKGYFETIKNKIDKDEVEVCVTGPVSAGKSVFLRALTGAPETVIPSGTSKTTAARTIFNNSDESEISAVIYFLSKEEFRIIVNEYVTQLNKVLSKKPNTVLFESWKEDKSLSEFCKAIKQCTSYDSHKFPKSTIEGVDTIVTSDKYFETFQLYIDHYSEYEGWIGHKVELLSKKDIDDGKLVKFVSYKKDLQSNPNDLYCLALAVKEAVVNWPLKTREDENLGALRLVDTMGIGEAKFCVETDLLDVVKKHADLAIALCRILSNKQDKDDVKNSSFIKVLSYLKDRKMEDWVYYLCNKEDDANITDSTVNDLREQLWKEMRNNADHFELRDSYWDAISFIKDGKENNNEIIDYFVKTVLGNLDKNISEVDDFFIVELKKQRDDYKKRMADLLSAMRQCLKVLPAFSDSQKTKEIDNEVSVIFIALNRSLENVRTELFNRDEELRKTIIKSVEPILKDAEIFQLYKTQPIEFDLAIAFNPFFRSAVNAINYAICTRDGFEVSWKDIREKVIERISKSEGIDKEKVSKLFEQQEDFFDKLVKQSCKAIQNNLNNIKSNLNNDDPKEACNFTGRELEFFIRNREKLYRNIWEKMSSSADKVGVSLEEIEKVKELLCSAVRDVLMQQNIIPEPKDKHMRGLDWLVSFSAQVESDCLTEEITTFVNAKIDLPSIVDDQTEKKLRRKLLTVNLNYDDEISAAKCIWYSLFNLDFILRNDLLNKYKQTFETYDVYVNMITPLLDKVFCLNQDEEGKTKAEAYKDLRAYIRNIVATNYEKKDAVKCADAAHKYRELCK